MSFSFVDDWVEKSTSAADSDKLLEYQLKKTRETLKYVTERSAFYRERLKSINGNSVSIENIPFTYPEDIELFSSEMLCVPQGMVNRVVTHKSSGTTMSPKRVFFTENDQRATVDFFHHGMREFTSEGDTVLILFPGEKEGSIGELLADGLNRFGARPLVYGVVTDFDDLLRLIRKLSINVIVGLPQQLLELSRLCLYKRITVPDLHSVLMSADYAAKSLVNAVEKNLGCLVYEHYGMTETCFGGGVYSRARDGYHLRHNDFLFEIVDTLTGNVLPWGECGEVVFTSLNSEAMPLIRYRTGDLASFAPHTNKYPVMTKIEGRLGGSVRLLNGQALKMAELDEAIFAKEDVLDFKASYNGNTLELYVRSLCFNAADIVEALRVSPVISVLNGCDIKVIASGDRHICKSTMSKRHTF